ncbi:CpsD/CapB family tyrosine-protein kinase [Enterococcus sp. DIV1298c]|uniref:Tyrosine-protein kinase CpsD n=1 Tax=Candidatus Enterococcus mangumiae TaxID=2230878 RepID=A0ABZ2T5B1_9ENTE|nr:MULTISPECIES: CpsD/CapB family tyrosine-protein kinase [unclassified Enterococcus]MBO0461277.1 CpsD/CapB family tyrosine-protein kinase [Enterococcus sp. DIV1298c]MBO0490422.1 CpsD/CapB family tyrosine-protein kinase [Enterococcus sp. DIV1094]
MKKNTILPVSLLSITDKNAMISEQYRTIRSNIQFASVDRELKTMVVTSSGPGEGKSTTAANLAVVFANSGKRVLLVDADLRKPSVALTFQLPNVNGLSNFLGDREGRAENYYHQSSVENMWVMTSGPKPPNPSELLDSKRMEEVIEQLKSLFDLIIFDLPPIATVTDAQILAAKTDGTLLVVRERKTVKQELIKAKELLTIAQATILGVVYNGAKKNAEFNYYYY